MLRARSKLDKALKFMRPVGRWIDRFLKERLEFLVNGPAIYVIGVFCIFVAATMAPLEILPFAASTAGLALTAFGLSLLARDGGMAILAFAFSAIAGGFWFIIS